MLNILFKYKEIILEIKYVKKFQDLENLRLFGYHAFRHTSAEYRHKNRESEKSHHEVKINCSYLFSYKYMYIFIYSSVLASKSYQRDEKAQTGFRKV